MENQKSLLSIRDLHVRVEDKDILRGLSLDIRPGEVHAIMGPNGSGKSTLSLAIAGKEGYEVQGGEMYYKGKDLSEMDPEERALEGIFISFQHPVEIPGVTMMNFLRTILNKHREYRGEEPLSGREFLQRVREVASTLGLDHLIRNRFVNEGFSGGEKKKNELLQMMLLEPEMVILDEIDSGLDIDAIKTVARAVNGMRDGKRSFLLITHYQRLLNFIEPDVVHILVDGRIVKSGDKRLAEELEASGYDQLVASVQQ